MNNINEREMKTPYQNLKSKRNNPSKPYLMVSELIDNSIASWEKGGKGFDLQINLIIDSKKKKIQCCDNAFGMSPNELLDSLEMNKEKTGNNLNMFGVGMKNAAFWFGKDLIITSNNGINVSKTSVKLSNLSDKDLNSPITWKLETTELKEKELRGTKISIENMYEGRLLTTSEIKTLFSVTEVKYRNYIIGDNKGVVNIIYKIIDKKGEIIKNGAITSNPEKAQIIPKHFAKNFLNNYPKEKESILFGLREKTIEKVNNGEKLLFKFPINFKGTTLDLKIGIQSQADETDNENKHFKDKYGITAYQHGRAIRIAGVNPLDMGFNYTRTDIKRVFGSFELGTIFIPDSNKSDFNFGVYKDEFKATLKKIGNDILILAEAVKNTIGKSSKVKAITSYSSRKKLGQALNAKSKAFFWEKFKSVNTEMTFHDKHKNKWIVKIMALSIENKDDENYFLNANLTDKKNKAIEIKFNVNHPIWKPLANNNTSIDMKTVTYPLVTILGLSKVGIQENLLSEWIMSQDTSKDYLEAISVLARFGLKI